MDNEENIQNKDNIIKRLTERKFEVLNYISNLNLPDHLSTGDIYSFYENIKELELIYKTLDILNRID
jgi:hypothetical protein